MGNRRRVALVALLLMPIACNRGRHERREREGSSPFVPAQGQSGPGNAASPEAGTLPTPEPGGNAGTENRGESGPPYPALACFELAQSGTLLTQNDAYMLCLGATSIAPVACFERATTTFLLNPQAIALCRCARSTAPIDCYERAAAGTTLTQDQIISLCSATAMGQLRADCTPIR